MNRAMLALMVCAVMVVGGCGRVMVPTPTIYWAEDAQPFADTPEAFKTTTAQLLYITDRKRNDTAENPVWYGYGRDKSMSYGTCDVEFGRGMTWDELVEASRGKTRKHDVPIRIGKVTELGRLPVADAANYEKVDGKVVERQDRLEERMRVGKAFLEDLGERVRQTKNGEVCMFVHGFNNDFQDPMYVAAQVWHFCGREVVPIVYTWPAGWDGFALFGYNYDRESGEFTIYHLKAALKTLAACPDVKKVHLIAHSRGTDVLMTALRELNIKYRAEGSSLRDSLKLGSLILAAPDIDMDVFSQRIGAERLITEPEQFTVYVSHADEAIGLSDWLFRSGRRLGKLRYADLSDDARQLSKSFSEVNIVDVTAHTTGLGHSYFYDCPPVLSDLVLTIRGEQPGETTRRPLKLLGAPFWELPEGYCCPK